MVNVLGQEIPIGIDVSGFISNTWWWVLIVVVLGMLIILTVGLLLFFRTYNRKVIVFENISGLGYQPVMKTRARIIKVGNGGEEVLKTLAGRHYVSAYGRKMGKNTYWYCKGSDGYWYNIVMGDLDAKLGMLDIEPIDRDVRMFHVSMDRMIKATYDKQTLANKILLYGLPILMIIVFLVGIYLVIGKIGDVTSPLAETNQNQQKIAESNLAITERLSLIVQRLEGKDVSLDPDVAATGLQPVDATGG